MLNQDLKQRLVGAAVLVAAGILIIPSVLKWPPEIAPGEIHGSKRGEYSETTRDSLAAPGAPGERYEGARVVSEQSNPAGGGPAGPSSPLARESRKEVPGWMVQIGSFAHQENALKMRNVAISSGYRAFIESVKKGTRIIYKVRVGPERNVNRAKALKRELVRQLHTKAFVVSPTR